MISTILPPAYALVAILILNNNMVAFMGHSPEYSERSAGNIINLLIWVVIIIIPLCVFVVFKLKKKYFDTKKRLYFLW